MLGCGFVELAIRGPVAMVRAHRGARPTHRSRLIAPLFLFSGGLAGAGTLVSLAWVAFKVGALSYGGGFVIIPLMQSDAVDRYHWMSASEFLNAVAMGQITPGPVVQTVAVVGYAAAGVRYQVVPGRYVPTLHSWPSGSRTRDRRVPHSVSSGAITS